MIFEKNRNFENPRSLLQMSLNFRAKSLACLVSRPLESLGNLLLLMTECFGELQNRRFQKNGFEKHSFRRKKATEKRMGLKEHAQSSSFFPGQSLNKCYTFLTKISLNTPSPFDQGFDVSVAPFLPGKYKINDFNLTSRLFMQSISSLIRPKPKF